MRLSRTKSEPERLRGTMTGALAGARKSPHRGTVLKAAAIAGGIAGLTAGSAAISSLRRKAELGS